MANIYDMNAAIDKPNLLGALQHGIGFGNQQRQLRETRADQQQLRQLAPGVISGDPSAYAQAAAIDPTAANAQLGAADKIALRAEGLVKLLEDADTRNPQEAQALWQNYGVPFARQYSKGAEPTADWNQAKPMIAQLKAQIAMAKAAQGQKGGPDVKVVGNALVDETGRVLYQGQTDSKFFQTDQGLIEVGPGGAAREVRLGQPPEQGMVQPPGPQGSSLAGNALYDAVGGLISPFGGRVTSTTGGQHNAGSLHPGGGAVDIGMGRESPEQQARILAALQGDPRFRVLDERVRPAGQAQWSGPHLHVEAAQGGQPAQDTTGSRPLLPAASLYQRQASERADRADARAEAAAARAAEQAELARFGNAPSGWRFKADGSGDLEPIPGGPKPAGAAATEGERKAATLLQRLNFSQQQLAEAVRANPDAASPEFGAEVARNVPFVGETLSNVVQSAPRQQVEAAQRDILDAALTLGTGAAYTKEQLEGYRRSYFPQIGDSEATVAAKAARLENVINAARIAAGRAAPQQDAQAPAAPQGRTALPPGFSWED